MSLDGIDFIFFDNLMTLVLGDLKEETTWTETLPLVHILTSMRIGQVWIDHTGWNEERAYGANVKLWQMDTVMRMKNASKTEIDFTLAFDKNRFKSPTNKEYYEEVQISLRNNKWIGSAPAQTNGSGKLPHKQQLAYQALLNLINEGKGKKKRPKRDMPVVTVIKQEDWREELFNAGVTDRDKLDSERSIRRNLRVALVNKDYIGFWKDELWVVRDTVTDRDNQAIDTAAYRNVT